jgi:hypothetical protein
MTQSSSCAGTTGVNKTLTRFVENTTSRQVHGIQDHHLLVCEAVSIDPAWYEGAATGQNSRPRTTPP